MAEELTPMMRQYMAIKREVPSGAIVMFRLGDFYEMFGEDAVIAAPILGATLTHRGTQTMCGIPHHSLNNYLAKLIRAGKTAALCEQVEDPKTAKGLVRREVTRIITPGTVTEDGLLDETKNNYIIAVCKNSLSALDLATGDFFVEEFETKEKLDLAVERYAPAEILTETNEIAQSWTFSYDVALEALTSHFNVVTLDGYGIEKKPDSICAAGALIQYVGKTLHHSLFHVKNIYVRTCDAQLIIDNGTIHHLQLLPDSSVSREATLLGVLDVTKTPMGARTLRNWIQRPLAKADAINSRLDNVQRFFDNRTLLSRLRQLLSGVRDMERLIQKVSSFKANPRDLNALASSLEPLPEIISLLGDSTALQPQNDVVELISRSIKNDPPVLLTDGGFIADGYNGELDELRDANRNGHAWIAEYQSREQQRTGISKLKVKYVPQYGFLIEIPKGSQSLAPSDYIRRQTLTTAERFFTPELKEHESHVIGAEERAIQLEQRIFRQILEFIATKTTEIQSVAITLGELDATMSLSDRALAAGYSRPVVDESDILEIKDSRHPIIEQLPDAEPFVPNNAYLNCSTDQIVLITGPNMAGKSTYIRQVATIAIMAQMGSFVPASFMRIGVLDHIFTRIGAGDDLSRGRSTFLVEMQETANILNNITTKSLVVLDEIGRGTSTFDGISIAWSVAEYLHTKPTAKAKTLFATHYHELTDLANKFNGVVNYTVKVKEDSGRMVFLRRIAKGIAEKSFGIHVASMAGLPAEVVKRAEEVLANLEANELDVHGSKILKRPRRKLSDLPGQMTFL
jgi:DNA mismatch repair protein MutS